MFIAGIVDGVEALKESIAIDEVEAFTAILTNVTDDKINLVRGSADIAVERTRPYLCIRCQFKGCLDEGT